MIKARLQRGQELVWDWNWTGRLSLDCEGFEYHSKEFILE